MADDIKFVIGVDDRDLIKAQKEQLKFQRNLLTIEKAYRKGDITAKRYNAELSKQTRELQKLGGSYNKASSEVRKFAYQLRTADDAALASSQSYAFAGKNVNRMGMRMQQAGYQIGDFAVQVQGGTNVMVALGQQGAQLLGIFGAGGAIAGAALAITTALIAPLFAARKAASEFVDELKDVNKELELLKSGASSAGVLSLNQQIADTMGKIYDIESKTVDLSYADAELKKQILSDIERKKSVDDEVLEGLKAQLRELLSAKEAIRIINGLTGDQVSEAQNLREEQIYRNRLAIQENKLVAGRSVSLQNQVSLLSMSLQFGRDSLVVQRLQDQQILKLYETELRRELTNESLVQKLLAQKSAAMSLADQLERAEAADQRRSKIKFSNLGMSGAMLALQYQEMGKSKASAPKEPPKPKKTGGGGGGAKESPQEKLAKYLQGKQQELTLEKQLVGVFDEERQIQTELFNIKNQYEGVITPQQEKELENVLRLTEAERERQEVLEEAAAQQQHLSDFIGDSMENAMMGIVDGTLSVKDAFKSMAAEIIKELYRVLVVQQMVAAAKFAFGGGSLFGGASWSADGDVVGSSGIQAYADGGVVNSPTMFKHGGGLGVMGEAGPEAIMPLKRGANGKLGVQMEGGGGQNVVINQSFNFQANGDDSVKKIIAQAAPQIAQMTKSSLLNDRRRGGATKAAFG